MPHEATNDSGIGDIVRVFTRSNAGSCWSTGQKAENFIRREENPGC